MDIGFKIIHKSNPGMFKETELREFEKEALSVESINLTFK